MLAQKVLDTELTPLKVSDSIQYARRLMDKREIACLPVTDTTTGKLIGQIKRDALGEQKEEETLHSLELEEAVKIYENQHIFEAVRLMLQYEMRMIPVVDEQHTFKGIIQKQDVLESISKMLNLAAYGSIVTIELEERDFSLSEVVHLIEIEGAKILGITVETPNTKQDTFEVSVKLNLEDGSRVASTLRRYGYNVVAESNVESYGRDLESRAGELIKYMDM